MRRVTLILLALLAPAVALGQGIRYSPGPKMKPAMLPAQLRGAKPLRLHIPANVCGTSLPSLKGPTATVTRNYDTGTYQCGGTMQTALANLPRVDESKGLIVESSSTQYFKNACTSPATQTTPSLAAGAYVSWVEGTGSLAITAGTVTATGLPCTATAASPCYFAVTVAGTATATVTGSLTYASVEKTPRKSSKVCSAGATAYRGADAATVANPLSSKSSAFALCAKFSPNDSDWNFAGSRGLMMLGTYNTANSANLYTNAGVPCCLVVDKDSGQRFQCTGSTVASGSPTYCCTSGGLLYIDGAPAAGAPSGTGTGEISVHPDTLQIGRRASGYEFGGGISDIRLCATNDLQKCGLTPKIRYDAMGDSITAYGDPTWPALVGAALGSDYVAFNRGVAGYTASQIYNTYVVNVQGIGPKTHPRRVSLLGGVNDIKAGTAAATVWATLQSIIDAATADGAKVVVGTVMPFKGWGEWSSEDEAQRLLLNELLKTGSGYTVVDTAAEFVDPNDAEALNPIYDNGDHLHINDDGRALMAALFAAALL